MCDIHKPFHDQNHHWHSNQEQEVPHFPQQTKGPKRLFAIQQAPGPGKISASHVSKGATIVAKSPPSNRALQLSARF